MAVRPHLVSPVLARGITAASTVSFLAVALCAGADVRYPGQPYKPARRPDHVQPTGQPEPAPVRAPAPVAAGAEAPAALPRSDSLRSSEPRFRAPAPVPVRAPAPAPAPAPVPAAAAAAEPASAGAPLPEPPTAPVQLTADNMATAPKPAGFSYSLIANAIVDDLSDTYLYVRASKEATTTKAVPVPRDRQLLAQCIVGGEIEDLVRNTVVTVKFDPTGVVRPEILVQSRPEKEHLTGVKISQRAGNKLFVVLADGTSRVFQIDGGPEAWQQAVAGGDANTLVPGAVAEIDYDPSGQDGIVIRVTSKPLPPKDKGCGCSAQSDTLPSAGTVGLGVALLAGLRFRRRTKTAVGG